MTPSTPQSDVPVVLLVGGLGLRLRSVSSVCPKALAPIGNRPFLQVLLGYLCKKKLRRFIMCTGYLGEQIEELCGNGSQWGISIQYSRESMPLDTAGALKYAARFLTGESEYLVLNGDSFIDFDPPALLEQHRRHNGTVATLAVVKTTTPNRYGTVIIDVTSRVIGFEEKALSATGTLINAGVYACSTALWERIPEGRSSLERDVFPSLVGHELYAWVHEGVFIDIGTPEDYARAQCILGSY